MSFLSSSVMGAHLPIVIQTRRAVQVSRTASHRRVGHIPVKKKYEPKLNIGPLSPKSAARASHMSFPKVQFDIPQRICAGTTTGLYVPTQPVMRPGADDHKKFKSKGF